MAEASVGIGKGYAAAVIAIERALTLQNKKESKCVVLTAPTYQLAKQLESSVQTLIHANSLDIGVKLVRSRAEYINSRLLRDHLHDKTNNIPESVIERCISLLFDEVYLRSEYEDAGLSCNGLSLSRHSDIDDPAELLYQSERSENLSEPIIVCTHAFLACHVSSLRRKAAQFLPDDQHLNLIEFNKQCMAVVGSDADLYKANRMLNEIDLLIVDEAHSLSASYQSLRENRLSLGDLTRSIGKVLGSTLAATFSRYISDFIEAATKEAVQDKKFSAALTKKLVFDLKPIRIKLKTKKNTVEKSQLLERLDNLDEFNARQQHMLYLSPVRREASIQTNAGKPIDWLNFTWMLANQAVLISGTLVASTKGSATSYLPIASKLAIPFVRIHPVNPIESSWLRESVTIYAPYQSKNSRAVERFNGGPFRAPDSNKSQPLFEKWVALQANYITQRIKQGTGGAIIVCTSYDQISQLTGLLTKSLKPQKNIHLLSSVRNRSIVSQVNEYKAAYRSGKRPIWLSIISVGTGVDISDDQVLPVDDKMLNTLFITRIPISVGDESWQDKMSDALILFQQIIGRLVRREGRSDMQIHVMDARATITEGLYNRFRSVILKYKDIVYLPEDGDPDYN
jgi:CRISPR type IV-associated DEAD/DEAH-box helicase Csf4